MLSYEQAIELFEYCPGSGLLRWKVDMGEKIRAGCVAGTHIAHNRRVCLTINVCDSRYFAHRVAWLIYWGKWPSRKIKHLDGCLINNRIENLHQMKHKPRKGSLKW